MPLLSLLYFGIILTRVTGHSDDKISDYDYNNTKLCRDVVDDKCTCHTSTCHEYEQNIQHSMNKFMDPCSDFYEYTCGNWERNNPVPIGELTWNWNAVRKIKYDNYRRIHEILKKDNEYDEEPFINIAKQYYRSCLNEDAIEDEGLKSTKLILNTTGGWPILMSDTEWERNNYTWQNINNIYFNLYGFSTFFRISFRQDEQNEGHNILMIHQFLHFPLEEIYVDDEYFKESIIKVVRAFAVDEGIQISTRKLQADVEEIIKFTTKLRRISGRANELYFLQATNRTTIAELQKLYDGDGIQKPSAKIDWLDTIQIVFKDVNVSINASEPVLVSTHHSLQELASLLQNTSSRVIVNYMQWNIVSRLMPYLNRQLRNIEFDFHSKYNVTEQKPRWLTCIQTFPLTDVMSYIFIKTYISADSIKAVLRMIDEIKTEIKERISLSWMNNNTKINIINKINNILPLIGYPKEYNNQSMFIERYKGLNFSENYLKNWLAITKYNLKKAQMNFRKRVLVNKNIDEFMFDPMLANTFYISEHNRIVIPAALIQDLYFISTPFYATMGFLIGHELSHSFGADTFATLDIDDLSKIQVNTEDVSAYTERLNCFVQHYNNFTLNVTDKDGKSFQHGVKVVIEIIADFIGIQAAFSILQKRKAKMEPQIRLPTFVNITDEKLFFLSFMHQFCESSAGLREINIAAIDEHGFTKYRIMTSLANMVSFSEAFNCPVGSLMNSELKCTI